MKRFYVILLFITLFMTFSVSSFAKEDVNEEIYGKLYSSLSDETKEMLENSGIYGLDHECINELSPKDFLSFFAKTLSGKIYGPVKLCVIITAVSLILSAAQSYFPDDEKRKKMLGTLSCIAIGLLLFNSVFLLIKSSMSAIDMTSKFMCTLLPILAGLIASCRNPVLALSMNSVCIYLANVITLFADKYLAPFMSLYLAVCCGGCISKELDLSKLAAFIKNTVLKVLGVLSSFYISFLSIKGLFANSVDTVASKGAKLLISTAVPVIGSSLSEAYFALSGSLSLLKNTVGIFGIIAIFLTSLPMITELFLWGCSLSLNVIICNILDMKVTASFLEAISGVVKTLNLLLIFCAALFIISIGLMISFRSVN